MTIYSLLSRFACKVWCLVFTLLFLIIFLSENFQVASLPARLRNTFLVQPIYLKYNSKWRARGGFWACRLVSTACTTPSRRFGPRVESGDCGKVHADKPESVNLHFQPLSPFRFRTQRPKGCLGESGRSDHLRRSEEVHHEAHQSAGQPSAPRDGQQLRGFGGGLHGHSG